MIILRILTLFFLIVSPAWATDYYADPAGSAACVSGCVIGTPCSLTTGLTCLSAGDTLYLKDGTYSQQLNIAASGTSEAYITVKALNDGQVTIDGNGVAYGVCNVANQAYINMEGLICIDGGEVVRVKSSHHVNVRKVSASQATSMHFISNGSNNVLFEDCFLKTSAETSINIYESQYVTVRRAAVILVNNTTSSGRVITLYGSDNCTIENNVILNQNSSVTPMGVGVWSNTYSSPGNYNKFYGNVVYNMKTWSYVINSATHLLTGNEFHNNVSINSTYGLYQRADDNLTVSNLMVVGGTQNAAQGQDNTWVKDGAWDMQGTVKNSSFLNGGTGISKALTGDKAGTSITSRYNNFYNVSTQYSGTVLDKTGDAITNPVYDTATYGKGAYLMVPTALVGQGEAGEDIGAKVLYRYVDGTLTGTPLWPWSMEARILTEAGVSVTYETNGGIWKTLTGVYPSEPPPPPPVVEKGSMRGGASLSGGGTLR